MSRAETTKTVLVAGTANAILAVTKLIAGVLAGSSAMLAEGAHSVADTLNQVFLFTSLRRSARPPDRRHPFGYGNERYFWSLLAAFGIFVAGGGYSIFEDTAAMIGLALAAVGLTLREITGSSFWDGLASILIGLLLVVLAFVLGRDSMRLLIGQAADPEAQHEIADEILRTPGVTGVDELLTMHFGPDELLVAAKVHFADDLSADQAEDIAGEIDWRLRQRLPIVRRVFLDPTQERKAEPSRSGREPTGPERAAAESETVRRGGAA